MPMIQDDHLPRMANLRRARSKAELDRIKVKNRRKRYLDLHPEYIGPDLELAARPLTFVPLDPLLYDRLVRRFQSTSERESEGRKKGYSGILEADLARSEAKLDAIRNPSHNDPLTYSRDAHGYITAEDKDEIPPSKEEALARWKDIMEQRFLFGHDTDFDYHTVDLDARYDDKTTEDRDAEDEYFDRETPKFMKDEAGHTRHLEGETGVQDF